MPIPEDYIKGYQLLSSGQAKASLPYFEKAAKLNYFPAYIRLALLYEDGEQKKEAILQATKQIKWFQEQYANAVGLTRDMDRAVFWYKKAAAQGNPNAEFSLKTLDTMKFFKEKNVHENQLLNIDSHLARLQLF